MRWLYEHPDLITAWATVGLLLVWVVYAQVFYRDYSRRLRPRIIIDQMSGPGTAASCVVTNLSAESVYLECVLAVAVFEDGEHTAVIREQQPISSVNQDERQIISQTRQGPLGTGQLVSLGTIEELVAAAADHDGRDAKRRMESVQCLDIKIVATMSSEDDPIGAWKRFDVFESGERARATRLGTQQMYSRREKKTVLGWLGSR